MKRPSLPYSMSGARAYEFRERLAIGDHVTAKQIVRAKQHPAMAPTFVLDTPDGSVPVHGGDWVVQNYRGDQERMSPQRFSEEFVLSPNVPPVIEVD